MRQGLAVPVNGEHPLWFGPLKRNFKGFSDLFGFEVQEMETTSFDLEYLPIFTVVEVKTPGDRIRPEQRRFLDSMTGFECNAYVAVAEDRLDLGYILYEWEKFKELYDIRQNGRN
jgi:hypothetical protein